MKNKNEHKMEYIENGIYRFENKEVLCYGQTNGGIYCFQK